MEVGRGDAGLHHNIVPLIHEFWVRIPAYKHRY
jgi:hypothetical protein